jgi:hypothetical protein
MRFVLSGGLGDQMAATAIVREYHRVFPDDMIRVDGAVYPTIWENNPHIRYGSLENGLTVTFDLGKLAEIGSIPHSFAEQLAAAMNRDFQIVNDTPEIFLTPAEREEGERRLLKVSDPCLGCRSLLDARAKHKMRIALMDPHAMFPSRRYPGVLMAELAAILKTRGWLVVQIGSTSPDSYGSKPEDLSTGANLADQATFRESMSMMYHADLFIGNDSGGFHMAAGVGCPQVAIFGVKKWYLRAYWNTTPVFPYVKCMVTCHDLCARVGGSTGNHCLSTVQPWRIAEAVEWAHQRYGRW